MSDKNMEKISDIDFKVLPVEINFKDAIITMDNQGIDNKKLNFQKEIKVHATHDIPTNPDALKTISTELTKENIENKER